MTDNTPYGEYAFLRVPYEVASSEFKRTRKETEKELNHVLSSIISLKNNVSVTKEQALENLSMHREKLTALKRRLSDDTLHQSSLYDSMKKRVNHISAAKIDQSAYIKTKTNRLIVEYFLLRKRFDQAEALSKILHIDDFCECERNLVKQLYAIINALQNKDLGPSKKWCSENRSKLSKAASHFQFKLQLMEYLQLLRSGQLAEAVQFLREQTLTVTPLNREEFQRAMGCLIFMGSDPAYEYFFSEERWSQLIDLFKSACFAVYQLRFESSLEKTLQVGISVLKTPVCSSMPRKAICPICQTTLNKLAEQIPYTTKTLSTLICRVTKEKMDESNPPMMLPNGQVFCKHAIDQLESGGKVTCPITDTSYDRSDIRRVFLF